MSLRSVVPALLLLSLILTAPRAFAGTYGPVVYAGGSTVNTSTQYTGTQTQFDHLLQNNPPTWGGSPAVGYGVLTNAQGPFVLNGTANSVGPITATFAWLPATGMTAVTDPPPPVIITETCVASTSILGHWPDGTSAAGSFVNPLGVSGIRYSSQSQAPISTSCEPKVSLTGTGALTATGIHELSGFVSYAVAVSPVTLNLTGPLRDKSGQPVLDGSGNQQILVGQGCTASLSGIPTGTGWKTTYAWSVSGTTFQSWVVSADLSHTTEVDGLGVTTNPGDQWYWNDVGPGPTIEKVTCTATVTPPVGQGKAFSITASQKVSVYNPLWTATGTGGTMQVNLSDPAAVFYNDISYWLYAGSAPGSTESGGMDWNATVSPPSGTLFGAGSLTLVQLITYNESYTAYNTANVVSTYFFSENNLPGLDEVYPYGWSSGPPKYFSGDVPGIALTNTKALSAQTSDKFEDFLMYFALGSSQCVPIAHFVWDINGSATKPTSGNWKDYGTTPSGYVSPTGQPASFLVYNKFPSWVRNNIAANGDFVQLPK